MKPFRMVAALWLAALAAGCSGDGGTTTEPPPPPPPPPVTGSYTLISINGLPLPVILVDSEGNEIEVVSGIVILNADMTFSDATTVRFRVDDEVVTENWIAVGTYTRTGNVITLIPTEGPTYTMVFDGVRRLTQILGSLTIVYQR
jgi:hypothetical protein